MGSCEGSWNSSVTSRSLSFIRKGNFSMSAQRGGEERGGKERGGEERGGEERGEEERGGEERGGERLDQHRDVVTDLWLLSLECCLNRCPLEQRTLQGEHNKDRGQKKQGTTKPLSSK